MFMSIHRNTDHHECQKGSALVIALIVLAILGALGYAALDVAELNIFISANDRDSKEAFFHADSGSNIAPWLLKDALDDENATFYDAPNADWGSPSNATNCFTFYQIGASSTRILGKIQRVEGIAGYDPTKFSLGIYHFRSHRTGNRSSQALIETGWKELIKKP